MTDVFQEWLVENCPQYRAVTYFAVDEKDQIEGFIPRQPVEEHNPQYRSDRHTSWRPESPESCPSDSFVHVTRAPQKGPCFTAIGLEPLTRSYLGIAPSGATVVTKLLDQSNSAPRVSNRDITLYLFYLLMLVLFTR